MPQPAVRNSASIYLLSSCYVFKMVLHTLGNKDVLSPFEETIGKRMQDRSKQLNAYTRVKELFFSFPTELQFSLGVMCPALSNELSKPIMACLFSFPRDSFSWPLKLGMTRLSLILPSTLEYLCEGVMPELQ